MAQKKTSFLDDLSDGLREGYKNQDEKLRDEKESVEERVKSGALEGGVEGMFNPFRWIKSIFF